MEHRGSRYEVILAGASQQVIGSPRAFFRRAGVWGTLLRLAEVVCLGAAGLVLLESLSTHFALIPLEWPQELREAAMSTTTYALLKGQNPYSLELQPQYTNVYGVIYSLITYPFAMLFGPGLPVHRCVSAVFVFASCGLLAWALRVKRVPWSWTCIAGVFFYRMLLPYNNNLARPDALGLFFFLASLLIPWRFGYSARALGLGIVLGVLGFLTKPYFVAGIPILAAYLFLFDSLFKATGFVISAAVVIAGSVAIADRLLPMYLNNTFFTHYHIAQSIISHVHYQLEVYWSTYRSVCLFWIWAGALGTIAALLSFRPAQGWRKALSLRIEWMPLGVAILVFLATRRALRYEPLELLRWLSGPKELAALALLFASFVIPQGARYSPASVAIGLACAVLAALGNHSFPVFSVAFLAYVLAFRREHREERERSVAGADGFPSGALAWIRASHWHRPIFAARPDLAWVAVAFGITVFVAKMGRHQGAYMEYIYHLISPFMLLGAFFHVPRAGRLTKVVILALLASNLFSLRGSLRAPATDPSAWNQLTGELEAARRPFGSQILAPALIRLDREVFDSAQSEYFLVGASRRGAFTEAAHTRVARFLDGLATGVRAKAFDVALVTDGYMPYDALAAGHLRAQGYRLDRAIQLETYVNGPLTVQVWQAPGEH